jgi:hypothetical protein
MTAVAGLCCLPILVWNIEHDWVTLRQFMAWRASIKTRIGSIGWDR